MVPSLAQIVSLGVRSLLILDVLVLAIIQKCLSVVFIVSICCLNRVVGTGWKPVNGLLHLKVV